MTTVRSNPSRLIFVLMLLAFATAASAQKSPVNKKLYCWNQNGQRTCGDTLPPGATDLARTVINARNGLATGTVARALTPEERATAAAAAQQAEIDAAAEAARQRRDMAMIESYVTEADLLRTYNERIALLDLSIKASRLGETNLRTSLVTRLNHAGDIELAGNPVPPATLAGIRKQHAELKRQQRILAKQQQDRAALDGELADALDRYRKLKQVAAAPSDPRAPPAAAGN